MLGVVLVILFQFLLDGVDLVLNFDRAEPLVNAVQPRVAATRRASAVHQRVHEVVTARKIRLESQRKLVRHVL